jgi:hypothetical protein
MNEKNAVLADAASNEKMILFFEHDPNHEACNVVATDKGYQIGQQIKLSEL